MVTKHILFEVGNLVTGADRDFAGYTNYGQFPDANAIAVYLENATRLRSAGKRPTRLGKPGGQFDGPLDIVAEAGCNRYYLALEQWSGTEFAQGETPIVPIGKAGALIHTIQVWKNENGKLSLLPAIPAGDQSDVVISFEFDTPAAEKDPVAQKIKHSAHGTAFKIPFYLNLIDQYFGAPPWTFDDHRYEPVHGLIEHYNSQQDDDHGHDHDEAPESSIGLKTHGGIHPDRTNKLLTHGGIHPDEAATLLTHGGIHPRGMTSFVIVDLS